VTVNIKIGRRVPKKWFKRLGSRFVGLITFQENTWIMLNQAFNKAKKRVEAYNKNNSDKVNWVQKVDKEDDGKEYMFEWLKIYIQGNESQEQEEYNEAMKMYNRLDKHLPKTIPIDKRAKLSMAKHLKARFKKNYEKGIEQFSKKQASISDKLLEIGIITEVEYIKDFGKR